MKMLALMLAAAAMTACSNPPSAAGDASAGEGSDAGEAVVAGNSVEPVDRQETGVDSADDTDAAGTEADYLGRWTGVEGMYLVVAKTKKGSENISV